MTRHPVNEYLAILRAASSYREGLATIQAAFPGVSGGALRAAFSRAGLNAPNEYVGQPTEDGSDIQVDWDECPDPQPDRYWVDKEPEPRARVSPHVSNDVRSWLIWSDCHIPFEDKRAFDLVLHVGRTIRPYGTAIIGDFGDMLSVSSHAKSPLHMKWQLKDEVEAVNARLDQIDSIGCVSKRFHCGNHESRGQRMAMKMALGLYDSLDPSELYRLKERGWEYYKYQVPAAIGKIHLQHDTSFCGKYAAWQNGAAFEASTVQGHTHAATCVYFGNVRGESHVSATLGWLGSREAADYIAPVKVNRNWQHAFGMIYVEPGGNSHFQLVPIVDYKCVVNGRLFVG